MPRKPLTACLAPGCPGLIPSGSGGYCEKHKPLKRASDKHYDRYKRDRQAQDFYQSPAWKKVRSLKVRRDPLCQPCREAGSLTPATMVHHAIEIRQDMSQALVLENCVSCCLACHNRLHGNK